MTRIQALRRPSRHLGTAFAPLVVAFALAACESSADAPAGMPPPAAAAVKAVTLEARDIALNPEYTARVRGSREIEIRPRVSGILLQRNYTEGGKVKAGQSLFSIDPAPFEAAAARAEADLAVAEARLAQARREAARLRPLILAKAASQQDLDNAESSQSVAAAEAKGAQARLREARLNLGYTRVESPIAGVAGRALLSDGALLAGPEALLTTVTQLDPVHVLFGLSDNEQLQMQRDALSGHLRLPEGGRYRVMVTLPDGSEYPTAGVMDFSDARVDIATGTTEARAVVANPAGLLRPGQFVRVRLEVAVRPGALEVPQRAVLEGPQGKFVYVIEEGKAAVRPVVLAEWHGDAVVVREGLKAGDQVIVDGVLKIGPGAPVQAAAPTPTPTPER